MVKIDPPKKKWPKSTPICLLDQNPVKIDPFWVDFDRWIPDTCLLDQNMVKIDRFTVDFDRKNLRISLLDYNPVKITGFTGDFDRKNDQKLTKKSKMTKFDLSPGKLGP